MAKSVGVKSHPIPRFALREELVKPKVNACGSERQKAGPFMFVPMGRAGQGREGVKPDARRGNPMPRFVVVVIGWRRDPDRWMDRAVRLFRGGRRSPVTVGGRRGEEGPRHARATILVV